MDTRRSVSRFQSTLLSCAALSSWASVGAASTAAPCIDYSRTGVPWVGNHPAWTNETTRDGDHLFAVVTVGGGTFLGAFDLSTPGTPVLLGTGDFAYHGRIVVDGIQAYVVERHGLFVYDVSSPATPKELGHRIIPYASDVALSGHYAFVAHQGFVQVNVATVDVSDPASPVIVGQVPTHGTAVAVSGNLLCVSGESLLQLFDVSDPLAPAPLGDLAGPAGSSIVITGDVAYVLVPGPPAFLVAVDLSSSGSPTVMGSLQFPKLTAFVLRVTGTTAYVVASRGVEVLDISNPSSMTWKGVIPPADNPATPYGDATIVSVEATADHVFVAQAFEGVLVYDASRFASPILGRFIEADDDSETPALGLDGSRACLVVRNPVTAAENGLRVLDVSDPAAPVVAGAVSLLGELSDVTTSATHAYVSQPSSPGSSPVVDLRDPAAPVVVGGFGPSNGVATAGNRLYSAWDHELNVYDISNPSTPVLAGQVEMPLGAKRVVLARDLAVVLGDGGLQIAKVQNAPKPKLLGTVSVLNGNDLAVHEGYVYVLSYLGRVVRVFDISKRNAPSEVGSYVGLRGRPLGIAIDYPLVYVSVQGIGIQLFEASDPSNIVSVGDLPLPAGLDADIALDQSGLFVAGHGLASVPEHCTALAAKLLGTNRAVRLFPAWPNPFRGTTLLQFEILRAANVRLEIFDPRGRRVCGILAEPLPEGRHAVVWNGLDDRGRLVPNGTYFVRLDSAGTRSTHRLTVLH